MKVSLNGVSKGHDGENLPATTLSYETGAVTLQVVETARRPTVLALIAAGRMVPDAGTVSVTGTGTGTGTGNGNGNVTVTGTGDVDLRELTAIVDAPDVSEPVGDLKLTAVVQEELMFAERPNSKRAVADVLDELDVARYAEFELQNVPPMVRLRILAELAASRPGIHGIVLTSPDRHGGDPLGWWAIASDLALRGLAVLVLASEASVSAVRDVSARFEADRIAEINRQAAAAAAAAAAAQRERDQQAEVEREAKSAPQTETGSNDTSPHPRAASDARAASAHPKGLA